MLILTAVLAFHSTALAVVLLASRKAVLVDEQGRAVAREGVWHERRVAAARGFRTLVR